MEIIGSGLIAAHLAPLTNRFPDTVALAAGVADSACSDPRQYGRERCLLKRAIEECVHRRLIYFSSAGRVYGDWPDWRDEQTPCRPNTAYGIHKLACENMIRESGCRHLILRLPNIVGPRQNQAQLIPSLVCQIRAGHVRVMQDATRDLLDIDRLVRIVDELVPAAPEQATFVVASGFSTPVTLIVDTLANILGTEPMLTMVPGGTVEQFCIDRLKECAFASTSFAEDYYEQVLRGYVSQTSGNGF